MSDEKTQAIVATEPQGLAMVVSPAEALARVRELQAFVQSVMQRGIDYDVIPGAGDKPTLLQPGAQKLCEVYGFAVHFEDDNSTVDWASGFFFFRKRAVLTSRRTGAFVGDGVGSCNSREDRYAWRWSWDKPAHAEQYKTRQTRNGKTQWRMPNEDIFSLVNTIEKMACKRALVHAVTGATRSSGVFTQDVEDLPKEAFGQQETSRSWESGPPDEGAQAARHASSASTSDAYADAIARCATGAELLELGKSIQAAKGKGQLLDEHVLVLSKLYAARSKELKPRQAPKTPAPEPEMGLSDGEAREADRRRAEASRPPPDAGDAWEPPPEAAEWRP